MAQDKDERSHNQPSHEAQVKGGQHSHQGGQQGSKESTGGQHNQGSTQKTEKGGRESQEKGGQHSHSGGQKK